MDCNKLKVIPQFVGSCWFNAFLMALLYSQGARKIMIMRSKNWDKKDKFLTILRYILKKNYNDPMILKYYNQIQPQLILFEFLKKYDKKIEKFLKIRIKKDVSDFGWSNNYLFDFIKNINSKTLDIYYSADDTIIINFSKNIKYILSGNGNISITYNYQKTDVDKEKKKMKKFIKDIPDFLVLYHNEIYSTSLINSAYKKLYGFKQNEAEVYNLDTYGIKTSGIKEFKDVIVFNGITYKLDSCVLTNYNKIGNNHSIVGITCGNERYVYNGWTKKTLDPAMKVQNGVNNSPCSLMKFDWNLRKDEEFCLNSKNCKLDFVVDPKNLCFSFGKGNRILLYTRVFDEEKTGEISSFNSSKAKLSDINKLVKDIYQIDKLNENELKAHISFFLGNVNINKPVEELRMLLFDLIIKKYDVDGNKDYKNKLNEINKLTKNIHLIDKLNEDELKAHISFITGNQNIKKPIKELRKDLFDLIMKNFDVVKNKDYISRKDVYDKFKSFKNYKGKLLKQQVFLEDYIKENYSSIDKMLLFHGIGTGKTCTSITIAESIMEKDKKMKALVILPARLKTNFIDELLSSICGMNRYISNEDFKKYGDFNTSKREKDVIRKNFMEKIGEKYEIISYESLRLKLMKSVNIKETIDEITKNRIVIIDEVHNLITTRINSKIIEDILEENKINKNTKMINGVIMRLMTLLANKTSKFFLLTATPVFDNYGQFIELVLNLCPDIKETDIKRNVDDLSFLINKLRGKVSFYILKDMSDYPKTIVDNIEIPLSKTQEEMINGVKDTENEFSPMFCITERQISISTYSLKFKEKVYKNLNEYAPKLKKLFGLLKLDGKHVVYSNFIQYCLYLIAGYLKKEGWNNFIEDGVKNYKTFVIWDASLNDNDKQSVKNVLNSVSNIDGKNIRVVLGSPSIKEGISFKHIQHLHQIDPVWNTSAKTQVEGRCIRYKSHDDIPLNHPKLKRAVVIHNYISVGRKDGLIERTCDSKIYYDIMKKKAKVISIIEGLLKKVSVDYYLWTTENSPSGKSSRISLSKEKEELEEIIKKRKVRAKGVKGNSCPMKRRPDDKGNCPDEFPYMRKNPKGFECCYKNRKKE